MAAAAAAAATDEKGAAANSPPPVSPGALPPGLPTVDKGIDGISDNKKAKLKEFYDKVWKPLSETHKNWPTSFKELSDENARMWCYKLMVARKFDVDAAKGMLETIIAFRVEHKTEDRLYFPAAIACRGFDMEKLAAFYKQDRMREPTEFVDKIGAAIKNAYTPTFHKTDKWGRPLFFDSYGGIHPQLLPAIAKMLAPVGKPFTDIAGAYHVHGNEVALRLTHFQDETFAKPRGARVLGIVAVIDVGGLSMAHLGSDMIAMISTMFAMDAKAYPEFLHKVLVVNCGALIRLAYGLVRPFLDARVQEKISFFAPGDASRDALREWIFEEDIPSHLGGKCKCPGGCVFIPSPADVAKELEAVISGTAGGKNGLAELGVPIAAGASIERELDVKAGDEVTWEWQSDSGLTVEFKVLYTPAKSGAVATEAVKPDKIINHTGSYACPEDGKVKLVFGNTFSWLRSKYVTLRTFAVPKQTIVVTGGIKKLEEEKPAEHAALD